MLLKIHFTGADLARTRVAESPDLLWETILSLRALRHRANSPDAERRRRATADRYAAELRVLLPLVRPGGYFPDFLTPAEGGLGLDRGLDALLSTPKLRLRGDLGVLARYGALPSWAQDLSAGRPAALRELVGALRGYYDGTMAALEPTIQAQVHAECALRTRVAQTAGVEAMLSGLGPSMRWVPPVLEVDYSVDQELHLGGRGLLFVPTFYRGRTPISLLDPELPPVLAYPIRRQPSSGESTAGHHLNPLLGHTRAEILRVIAQSARTTSEIARLTAVSNASASQHATVLRDAGLITSTRHRNMMLHTVTPLGSLLLRRTARASLADGLPRRA